MKKDEVARKFTLEDVDSNRVMGGLTLGVWCVVGAVNDVSLSYIQSLTDCSFDRK